MMRLLEAVTLYGTAAQAGAELKHPLGGKTGTTNNFTDAWFIGFSPSVTCGTWIGFDDRKSLGEKETGARAALPMWIDFMKTAIARTPKERFPSTNAKKTLAVAAASNKPEAVKPSDDDIPDLQDDDTKKPATPEAQPTQQDDSTPSDSMPAEDNPASPKTPKNKAVSPRL